MVCAIIALISITFEEWSQNQHQPPKLLIEPINKDLHRIYWYTLALHCFSAAKCLQWNWSDWPVMAYTRTPPLCLSQAADILHIWSQKQYILTNVFIIIGTPVGGKPALAEIHQWFSTEDCKCLFKGIICLTRTRTLKSVLAALLCLCLEFFFLFVEEMNCSAITIKKKSRTASSLGWLDSIVRVW